jgi:hypothetical protein
VAAPSAERKDVLYVMTAWDRTADDDDDDDAGKRKTHATKRLIYSGAGSRRQLIERCHFLRAVARFVIGPYEHRFAAAGAVD